MSSKLILICNVLSLIFFLAIIAMQMMEAQTYTGSLIGFFQ